MNRKLIGIGSLFMATAVLLGAFGAHALKNSIGDGVTAELLHSYQQGVKYQVYHGLALTLLGIIGENSKKFRLATKLMIIGTLLFSVSIYILSLRGFTPVGDSLKAFGPITPIGGLCLITSWGLLTANFLGKKSS